MPEDLGSWDSSHSWRDPGRPGPEMLSHALRGRPSKNCRHLYTEKGTFQTFARWPAQVMCLIMKRMHLSNGQRNRLGRRVFPLALIVVLLAQVTLGALPSTRKCSTRVATCCAQGCNRGSFVCACCSRADMQPGATAPVSAAMLGDAVLTVSQLAVPQASRPSPVGFAPCVLRGLPVLSEGFPMRGPPLGHPLSVS